MIYNYSIADDIYTLTNVENEQELTIVDYKIKLDYTTLNKYDINTEDYKNQVIGSIKISFSQNSSVYDKEYDLVLNNIEQIPWLNRKSTQKLLTNIVIVLITIMTLYILLRVYVKLEKKKRKSKQISSRYVKGNVKYKSRRKRQV